jgi:transcriptional regulator with XRE-family HTH domain
MGRAGRLIPKRLGAKLRAIRIHLRLNQKEMVKALDYHEAPLHPNYISEYERGLREPYLGVLLRYARLVKEDGVTVEMLIDDKMQFPAKTTLRLITRIQEDEKVADKLRKRLIKSPK